MKKAQRIFTRLMLTLLISLAASSSLPVMMENEKNTASPFFFAVAKGSESPSPTADADEALLQQQYDTAQALFDAQEYEKAAEIFESLDKFSDSRKRASDSKKKWRSTTYKEAQALYNAEKYYDAKALFESLGTYERSRSFVSNCIVRIRRIEYQQAKEMYIAGDYENAQKLFESFGKYLDSPDRAKAAANAIQASELAALEETYYEKAIALKEAGDLEGARDAFIEAGACKDATEQVHAIVNILAFRNTYQTAENFFTAEDYENAYFWFQALSDYEDSAEKAALSKKAWQSAVYQDATGLQSSDPSHAYILFLTLENYKDSAALLTTLQAAVTEEDLYDTAQAFEQTGDYSKAYLGFHAISAYKDSEARAAQAEEDSRKMQDYQQGLFFRSIREDEAANALFKSLGQFNNASKMIQIATPLFTATQLRDDRTSPMSEIFTAPDGTKHRYRIYKGVRTWVEAKLFCEVLGGHLATLTTPEENDFVNNFMQDSGFTTAYFGLSDEQRTGNWEWVTGEPFEYSKWNFGEPSRSARERYGMYFYKHTDASWNDSHFYEHVKVDPGCSFICEWDE